MLEGDEKKVRKACAEALDVAWPDRALVPALNGFLECSDPGARAYAAKLLGRIGPEAQGSISALIAVLNEPIDSRQGDRSDAIVSLEYPALSAVHALGEMGPNREAIAALVALISPERVERSIAYSQRLGSEDAQRTAARAAGKSGPPISYDRVQLAALARLAVAVQELGNIGPPAAAAVPALISAYKRSLETGWSPSPTAIPTALGRIAPNSPAAPEVVALLIRGIDAKYQWNRLRAIEALAQFGADAAPAMPRLRALCEDSDTVIRDAALTSMAALNGQPKPVSGREPGRRSP